MRTIACPSPWVEPVTRATWPSSRCTSADREGVVDERWHDLAAEQLEVARGRGDRTGAGVDVERHLVEPAEGVVDLGDALDAGLGRADDGTGLDVLRERE